MSLIVVSGAIANKLHQGGEAWVRLSYLLGLRRLGYQVYFLEQMSRSACVDEQGVAASFEDSANRRCFQQVMDAFGFSECATLLPCDETGSVALSRELADILESADALLNISGHLSGEGVLARCRNKVFIDIDPGYTQFWHAEGNPGARVAGHDFHYTIGENIGSPECPIPTVGVAWRKTRPPVVLAAWPVVSSPAPLKFTTVANWRGSYGSIDFGGRTFGLKVHEFRKILELPGRCSPTFEIALNIHRGDHKDKAALQANGWQISDPVRAASTPECFQRYIQQSGAEFSVAQGIYVDTNSGWFSDRTVRYLASGKPALVQETSFSRQIDSGVGLVPFRTLEEAVRGAEAIASDYAAHCRAARRIAEEYFDSDKVLGKLMEEIGVAP